MPPPPGPAAPKVFGAILVFENGEGSMVSTIATLSRSLSLSLSLSSAPPPAPTPSKFDMQTDAEPPGLFLPALHIGQIVQTLRRTSLPHSHARTHTQVHMHFHTNYARARTHTPSLLFWTPMGMHRHAEMECALHGTPSQLIFTSICGSGRRRASLRPISWCLRCMGYTHQMHWKHA